MGKIIPDDAIKISKSITVDMHKLEREGMLSKVGGVINLTPLHKSNLKINPMELDKFDIYQQLSYLCKICDESGVGK